MIAPVFRIVAAGLISAGIPLAAMAADEAAGQEEPTTLKEPTTLEEPTSLKELTEFAENSTFVWLEEPESGEDLESGETLRSMSIREFAAQFEGGVLYEGLGGVLLPLNTEQARRSIRAKQAELRTDRRLPKVKFIEPNSVVHAFDAGCVNVQSLPDRRVVPPGVRRVNGPASGPFSGRVWIIDSGITDDFDGSELNVNRPKSLTCNVSGCSPNPAVNDVLGHGTAIAGIVGANVNAEGKGLVGIAPGAELVAVKVFAGSPHISLATAYHGVAAVADDNNGAQSGDVVNISWGADWNWFPGHEQRMIEDVLVEMAERGVKIAVAAGNTDSLKDSGYVQTVSPARAGAFRDASGGAIITVSAAHSQEDAIPGDWTDVFWPGSAFGNGKEDSSKTFYLGPPDFAEPGVDIVTLWPSPGAGEGKIKTCTGTSFATAHMSGILATGMPKADGVAEGDPSARNPETGLYDPARLDRIGVH
jgi:hypothetical protein